MKGKLFFAVQVKITSREILKNHFLYFDSHVNCCTSKKIFFRWMSHFMSITFGIKCKSYTWEHFVNRIFEYCAQQRFERKAEHAELSKRFCQRAHITILLSLHVIWRRARGRDFYHQSHEVCEAIFHWNAIWNTFLLATELSLTIS